MNMLRQISLGAVGLVVGGILTLVGFVAYATDNPTLNLVGFFTAFRCFWAVWRSSRPS
jgi:uncharacterized Tic20 family protein